MQWQRAYCVKSQERVLSVPGMLHKTIESRETDFLKWKGIALYRVPPSFPNQGYWVFSEIPEVYYSMYKTSLWNPQLQKDEPLTLLLWQTIFAGLILGNNFSVAFSYNSISPKQK